MVEIRNLKFQPLALHLANSKRSVHLPPRGRTEINDNDVSTEIRRAAERGFITLREVEAKPAPPRVSPPVAAKPTLPAPDISRPKPAPKPKTSDAPKTERS